MEGTGHSTEHGPDRVVSLEDHKESKRLDLLENFRDWLAGALVECDNEEVLSMFYTLHVDIAKDSDGLLVHVTGTYE